MNFNPNPQPNALPKVVTEQDRLVVEQMQNATVQLSEAAIYFAHAQAVFNEWIESKQNSRITLA